MDHNATTPVRPEVVETMTEALRDLYGNPSTLYGPGRDSHEKLDWARGVMAGIIGAKPEEIVFTSGGTESDNIAVFGVTKAMRKKGNHVITTPFEHHAVLNPVKQLQKDGWEVTFVRVGNDGIVNPADVEAAITDKTVLISIMHANNEIGTIQPIAEIGKIAKKHKITFHSDTVQTFAKHDTKVDELGVDLLSASSHKIYGPKGVGMLYVRKGVKLLPIMFGGHQERSIKPGTENVPGIVGFARAAELLYAERKKEEKRLSAMRDRLWEGISGRIPHVHLHGHPDKRLAGTLNVGFAFVEGESLILSLDEFGICVASGSACTSDVLEPSHVLTSIGIPPEGAHGALRISLGRENKDEDVDAVLEALPKVVENLRAFSPLYKKFLKEQAAKAG